jgi:hypothetical protein
VLRSTNSFTIKAIKRLEWDRTDCDVATDWGTSTRLQTRSVFRYRPLPWLSTSLCEVNAHSRMNNATLSEQQATSRAPFYFYFTVYGPVKVVERTGSDRGLLSVQSQQLSHGNRQSGERKKDRKTERKLSVLKLQVIRAYRGCGLKHHAFSPSLLDADEWSASRSVRLTPETEWASESVCMRRLKTDILFPAGN